MADLMDERPVTMSYDLAHMAVCGALRYYMGRATIGAHAVADGIAELLPQLTPATRDCLARDIRRYLEEYPTLMCGPIDDSAPWAWLLAAIEEEPC